MGLYREDATGFLVELSGATTGYTAVSAMPEDTIDNRVTWWRARDVDAALGQSSVWHPSLGGAYENPNPVALSGSGTNIAGYRYAAFDEPALPPLTLTSITATQSLTGYLSARCLSLTATAANGTCYLNAASNQYNIKLSPGKKWIISIHVQPQTAGAKAFAVQIKTSTAGAVTTLALTSGATSGAWTRVSGVMDLTSDTSPRGVMALRVDTSGVNLLFDGIMIEEQIGTGTTPSAFSGASSALDGNQLSDGSIPSAKVISLVADKLDSGTIGAKTIILNGASSILQSADFVAGSSGWRIRGDGAAEFLEAIIRGTLNANDIVTGTLNGLSVNVTNLNATNLTVGTINGARFGNDTIGGGPIIAGTLHTQRGLQNAGGSIPYDAAVMVAGTNDTWTAALSLPANANRTAVLVMACCFPTAVATAVNGWLVGCVARGAASQANVLTNGRFWTSEVNGYGLPLNFFFYDTGMGTGSVNYYTGWHHSMKASPQTQPVNIAVCILEFSKA